MGTGFFKKYIYDNGEKTPVVKKKETEEEVIEETVVSTPAKVVPAAPVAAPAAPVAETNSLGVDAPIVGMYNQDMMDTLEGELKANRPPTPGYLAFKESIVKAAVNLHNLPEASRFQTVFSTMNTFGLTRPVLMDSIAFYQGILVQEKAGFASHIEAQVAEKVTKKQEDIDAAISIVETKQAEMEALQLEINEIDTMIRSDVAEMNTNDREIKQYEANFTATVNALENSILEDVGKIDRYIPDPDAVKPATETPSTEGEQQK